VNAASAGLTAERALALLARGSLRPLGLLPGASNDAFLCRVSSGELEALAVYKPRDGEAPLWDFPDGTLYLREVAAHVVSEALGWGIVPPTVVRDGPYGVGAVQLYVDHDPAEHYFTLVEDHADAFRRVACFDLLINNADRKAGHCLLERGTERIFVVDHGVAFHAEPKLRTVIWDFAGEPIPDALVADVARFAAALDGGPVGRALAPLLAPAERAALARRAARIVDRPVFPPPGPGRRVPWPPI
jgi:uncharacterized repeat protein (TIGR03843 family)